ncbi:MAG: lipoyl(octanoyl) transferase LipB [Mariprofundaceae bacterium]|nr:lipoyl(octanoyl) transferase LipB [Mariprofundaceae bacterium]
MDNHAECLRVIRHTQQAYPNSIAEQETEVDRVLKGTAPPCVILTGHPPLFTIGTSGHKYDVLLQDIDGEHMDVFETGRGGEVTYHGPGQLIVYVIADLREEQDLHKHVWRLEEMVIRTLTDFGVAASRNKRGIGVWSDGKKIAAIGVRCRKWISYHGVALNIAPELKFFSGIVPCGMHDAPVTSMQKLGVCADRNEVEQHLLPHARELFAVPHHVLAA